MVWASYQSQSQSLNRDASFSMACLHSSYLIRPCCDTLILTFNYKSSPDRSDILTLEALSHSSDDQPLPKSLKADS